MILCNRRFLRPCPSTKVLVMMIFLYVTLHLESGQKLLFFVDTGMPYTVLDKSLESKLGKRLGTSKGNYSWYGNATAGIYAAPQTLFGRYAVVDK